MVDYSILTGGGLWNTLGELTIIAGLFYYLVSFYKLDVLSDQKSSLIQQQSTAFSSATFIISIVLAFNFYNFYVNALSKNNILLSNQILANTLNPIAMIYLDDLKVSNKDEKFHDYIERQSKETKLSQEVIRQKTLDKLHLSQADDNQPIKNLVKASLNQSVLKIANQYSKQVPILISLGLGAIIQTFISASTFVSSYFTWALVFFLKRFNLLLIKEKQIQTHRLISGELQKTSDVVS